MKLARERIQAFAKEMEEADLTANGGRKAVSMEETLLREETQACWQRAKVERSKSERMLLHILPKQVADQVSRGEVIVPRRIPQVTVLFADVDGFTSHSAAMPCVEMVCLLNDLFFGFDLLAEAHGVDRIKTIGDAYMAVGGLFTHDFDHAAAIADLALGMVDLIEDFRAPSGEPLTLRIGLSSGPVVAGMIGRTKTSYDLWGHTVNVAGRMESHGEPGRIQVSEPSYELLSDKYSFEKRGAIEVRGQGRVVTYFLNGKQPPRATKRSACSSNGTIHPGKELTLPGSFHDSIKVLSIPNHQR